ncbi:sedoheptulokinase [Paenibacillus sp. FSL R7-0331]|uniref:sedoheptulokinase n=1 Tax=Paenibacillus sp. FSL R7-0331 TaxID=1536773 RepID=UPI00069448AD|nr:FGGY family carbohydrate kinase [Paenibacillus sp. FSL R7-0331]
MKFVGLDIGTTSITGLVYSLEHKMVLCSITEECDTRISGHLEAWEKLQDPEVIWASISRIIEELILTEEDIIGIGLSGQMHGILYTNNSGQHVSPLYTWQDGRAGQINGDGLSYSRKLSALTGYSVPAGYGLATHYYNLQHGLVPDTAVSLCTIADYVALRLTGSTIPVADATQAAAIGCYSFSKEDFDYTAIRQAGIEPGMLPKIVPSSTLAGYTQGGIPVYSSLGDNQASFLGSVPFPGQSVLVNIGTGSQLSALLPDGEPNTSEMETRPFPGGGRLVVGAALSGGKSYALLEQFYRDVIRSYTGEEPGEIYSFMEQLLNSGSPPAQGVAVNTQFLGTRSDPEMRGSIGQITLDNFTPANLAHGFLQGMADELYAFYEALIRAGNISYSSIIGSGNALRLNDTLREKVSMTFGLPFAFSLSLEEAAVGAALCAAVGSGSILSFREAGQYIELAHPEVSATRVPEADRQRLMDIYGLSAQPEEPLPALTKQISTLKVSYSASEDIQDEEEASAASYRIMLQPGVSIGPLFLGMTQSELERAGADFPVYFRAEYDHAGFAAFIEIANPWEHGYCIYASEDLFRTPAAELTARLDLTIPYERSHTDNNTLYTVPELGFTLWRSGTLTEADLLTEEYLALPADIYEDEKRYLFFESLAVFPAVRPET